MPAITRINDQKRYDELLNARRTSVIEAAKLVYQTKQWIAKKESELRPISEFKLKMESQVTAGTRLASEVQAIVTQHEDRIEKLNEFKRMLVHFQQNIQEYNTLQHPVELRWYSDVYCYCPHAMVSFDNKFLSRWYYQQGCDVSGSCFYESLKLDFSHLGS